MIPRFWNEKKTVWRSQNKMFLDENGFQFFLWQISSVLTISLPTSAPKVLKIRLEVESATNISCGFFYWKPNEPIENVEQGYATHDRNMQLELVKWCQSTDLLQMKVRLTTSECSCDRMSRWFERQQIGKVGADFSFWENLLNLKTSDA